MRGVTEALLFFARSKGDQMDDTMPIISVKEVCEDLVSEYEIQANEKNLSLKLICRNNIMARMSETHLIIVVRNLLQNALNNTEAGGVLMVINENCLSISDTGRGIEGDSIEKIFDLCYHSPESSGSGLGLYLVMNICNFYGLDLNLDSKLNKGSTFHVRFPEIYFQGVKPVIEQA